MAKLIPSYTPAQAERFWSQVAVGEPNQCWNWLGETYEAGYGNAGITGAHRVAYFLWNDSQPGRLQVCHSCDNPPCCNPAHLFLGTPKVNADDREKKGRGNANGRPGEPRNKISREAADDIQTSGESLRTYARRYGITVAWASQVRAKKAWKKPADKNTDAKSN